MGIALGCSGVTVSFDSVKALNDVSLTLESGKIHALLGQNGAGKTTLARFFSGLIKPDTGRLEINGCEVEPGEVSEARAQGLEIVHQRFTLPPTFSVSDALELSATLKKGRAVFSTNTVAKSWGDEMQKAGIDASPFAKVGSLPIETVQSLEILRALSGNARILILDEPTALLSPGAIASLFERLRKLRADGVSLLVILHKLQEVLEIADTVTVLRDGRLVANPTPIENTSSSELSDLMIGGDGGPSVLQAQAAMSASGKARLVADSVTTASQKPGEPELTDATFVVRESEILGVAGVEGNGQRQLADLVCGFAELQDGKISLDGVDLSELSLAERRRIGIRIVPFDRMSEGASLATPLWENVTTWRAEEFRKPNIPFLSVRAMKQRSREILGGLGVKFDSLEQSAMSLSGGNLQRLILARELENGVKLLVAAQPTRGLDFSATDFVLRCLEQLRNNGAAVIMMSSDLDELFDLSDRVIVLRGGRIAGEFQPPYDRQLVGDAMVGATR